MANDNSELLPASAHLPIQFANEGPTKRVNAYRLSLQVLVKKMPIDDQCSLLTWPLGRPHNMNTPSWREQRRIRRAKHPSEHAWTDESELSSESPWWDDRL